MRNIFIVNAQIVDANGAFNTLSDYPKIVDSNSYSGDVDKARKRADGLFCDAWGAMCKIDTRQLQCVTLNDAFGNQLDRKSTGAFAE